jgi:predicted transcriptional regulator
MVSKAVRTHIVVSRDLLDAIDRAAGRRRRSEFIAEALREKLTRLVQRQAFNAATGILADADYPEWETPEKTSAWVRSLRADDERSRREKLRDNHDS